MNITITSPDHPSAPPASLTGVGFGRVFADRMFSMDYTPADNWHNARIEPLHALTLHPACCVFHYGAEVFEGLKAYRRADGGVQLFRPIENGRRLFHSCERMDLPPLDPDAFVEAVTDFVREEVTWVPNEPGTSLW